MKKILEEFKKFAFKGNVFDMAIGVVIGTAFSNIVSSLVNDIIMPIVSLLTGGIDFTYFQITLSDAEDAAAITYGNFIQNIIDFLIIASSIFFVVRMMNKISSKIKEDSEEEKKEETPAGPTELELLAEIRDLLKEEKETETEKE